MVAVFMTSEIYPNDCLDATVILILSILLA